MCNFTHEIIILSSKRHEKASIIEYAMRTKLSYILVSACMFISSVSAQTIIPFRNVPRTFAAGDSVTAEAVVPTCSIAITEDSKAQVTPST